MCLESRFCLNVSRGILCCLLSGGVLAQEPWKNARLFDQVGAGQVEAVKTVIRDGSSVNSVSPFYGSLLKHAVAKGHNEMVEYLLGQGADPKADGNEALLLAPIYAKRLDMLARLLAAGAPANKPAQSCSDFDYLVAAATSRSLSIVKLLVKYGADPNGTEGICNQTALLVAASNGDTEIIQVLLEAGADINHRDWNGWSALMHACSKGRADAVRLLREKGARADFRDGYERDSKVLSESGKGQGDQETHRLCQ